MNFKSTALLFGLLLAMLWTFGLMLALKRLTAGENAILPSLQGDSDIVIDKVQVQRTTKDKKKDEVVFTKDKDDWRMQQPPLTAAARVESFKVTQLINQVKEASKDPEADVTDNLAYYDLDHPALTVILKGHTETRKGEDTKKGPEKEWKLFVGKDQAGFVYVESSDQRGKVAAVKKSSLDTLFFQDPNSFRPKTLVDVLDTTARLIKLHKAKPEAGEVGDVEFKKEETTWHFIKPAYGLADFEGPKEPESKFGVTPPKQPEGGVKGLLNAIGNIRVASDVDFVALSDASMSEFGLEDGKENMRIQVSTTLEKKDDAKKDAEAPGDTSVDKKEDANKDVLLVGRKVKDQYYARLANDQGVVKIDAKALEPIIAVLRDPGKLRSRDLIPAETKNIDAIDIRQGKDLNVLVKLRHPESKPWDVYFGTEAKKADENTIKSLIEALQGKREVKDFIDFPEADAKKKDADLGFDSPTAQVTLYSEGLEKPDKKKDDKDEDEKKDDKAKDAKSKDDKKSAGVEPKLKKDVKPLAVLVFGKVDKDLVYVKRTVQDGPASLVSRLQVPKSILDKATPAEGAIAFLDSALPPFDLDKVSRFELDRGKDKVLVVKGKGDQSFRWVLPDIKDYAGKNFADTLETNQLLGSLSELRAQKWLPKPDAKDLEKYGLAKPELTVKVTLGGQEPVPAAAAWAGILSLLGSGTPEGLGIAASTLQAAAAQKPSKAETVTFEFGKEVKDKDNSVVYALRSGTNLMFQVTPAFVKSLREADLRDRSWLSNFQPLLDAGLVGSLGAPEGAGLLWAFSPLTTGQVLTFDAAKVSDIKLAVRSRFELRHLSFKYDVKDKTWQDKSGLIDFTVDAEKIKQLLSWLSELNAERFIFLTGGPREENKLTDKDATLKIDIVLGGSRIVSLTAGSDFTSADPSATRGYLATSSAWPAVVFVVPASKVDPILEGAGYFGKARVASR